jgi:hypothetical protein
MREKDEGMNLTKIYCKHLCKCHNVSPIQILYANKKKKRRVTLLKFFSYVENSTYKHFIWGNVLRPLAHSSRTKDKKYFGLLTLLCLIQLFPYLLHIPLSFEFL